MCHALHAETFEDDTRTRTVAAELPQPLITDADCRLPSMWLSSVKQRIELKLVHLQLLDMALQTASVLMVELHPFTWLTRFSVVGIVMDTLEAHDMVLQVGRDIRQPHRPADWRYLRLGVPGRRFHQLQARCSRAFWRAEKRPILHD